MSNLTHLQGRNSKGGKIYVRNIRKKSRRIRNRIRIRNQQKSRIRIRKKIVLDSQLCSESAGMQHERHSCQHLGPFTLRSYGHFLPNLLLECFGELDSTLLFFSTYQNQLCTTVLAVLVKFRSWLFITTLSIGTDRAMPHPQNYCFNFKCEIVEVQ